MSMDRESREVHDGEKEDQEEGCDNEAQEIAWQEEERNEGCDEEEGCEEVGCEEEVDAQDQIAGEVPHEAIEEVNLGPSDEGPDVQQGKGNRDAQAAAGQSNGPACHSLAAPGSAAPGSAAPESAAHRQLRLA